MAELLLTTPEGFFTGAKSGSVFNQNDRQASRLLQVIGYEGKIKMPPTGKLSKEEIQAMTAWVEMGAPWPKTEKGGASAAATEDHPAEPVDTELWAFRKVQDRTPPPVKNEEWIRTPIDQFILAKLEENGLEPSKRADKLTLLRRAKFDLHGLPPSVQETEEFLSDTALDAFERLVERLLASPRYGEKWGRHWLDIARYADSTGLDEDQPLPYSWRYRDYVIDAFNRDLPYDRFVKEQLAGDLLPAEKPGTVNVQGITATGFLALGPKPLVQQDKMRMKYDVVDEQIDTVSKAFMGLTVACARCHDHKFDPISTKDYYSLASIFASTRSFEDIDSFVSTVYFAPLVPRDQYEAYKEYQNKIKIKELRIDSMIESQVAAYSAEHWEPRVADYMIVAREIYNEGAQLETATQQSNLAPETLSAWVDYLRPGREFRPYLEKWYQAGASQLHEIATEYQDAHAEIAERKRQEWKKWNEDLESAAREGKAPPERPGDDPAGADLTFDRFFDDLHGSGGRQRSKAGPFFLSKDQREQILPERIKQQLALWRQEMEDLKKRSPTEPAMASAVTQGEPVEQRVFVAGSHNNPGEPVARQFPVILAGTEQIPITAGSGRLELAEWLAQPDHPLTARVMVNRIWQWHFGEALVRSPNNFGAVGEKPTHPKLLDYLAREFVKRGWSVKTMHRLIMNSSVYQMSSNASEKAIEKDPDNQLWSHFIRRRLTVEEMRDSFLAFDGTLDLTMGGRIASVLDNLKGGYEKVNFNPDAVPRRTVYLPLTRNKLPNLLRLFNFVDSATSTEARSESNVAPQALFMMNSEFVHKKARSLAEILLADSRLSDEVRLEHAYRITLGRQPNIEEAEPHLDYVSSFPKNEAADTDSRVRAWESLCRILMASNAFNYVD